MALENNLSIVIATYNHSSLLESTLKALLGSPVRDCRITVLNNKSTDDTLQVCQKYIEKFSNLSVYSQPVNLGGGSENYIHAIEFCDTEYLWQLADDDVYDFSGFDDVKDAILSKKYDVIQVGAHGDEKWDWGIEGTPRELCDRGYNYFRASSFLPCDIIRYSFYTRYIKEAYAAISLWYPHMASLIAAYKEDASVYLCKKRVVTAVIGAQTYGTNVPIRGFVLLSEKLDSKEDKRRCILSQLTRNIGATLPRLIYHRRFPKSEESRMIFRILFKAATFREKLMIVLTYVPVKILCIVKPYKAPKRG